MLEKSVPLFAMPTSPHVPYLTPHRRDFLFFILFFVGTGHIRLIKSHLLTVSKALSTLRCISSYSIVPVVETWCCLKFNIISKKCLFRGSFQPLFYSAVGL